MEKGEGRSFGEARNPVRLWLRTLRVHQWAKNILIFLPIVAGHKLMDAGVMGQGLLAMASFCLCASSVYIVNDLLDLEADRSHGTKCRRPFAAGDVPASHGLIAAPLLLAGGIACGWFLPPMFLLYLAAYYFVSMLYSWVLKKEALLDVFALASLYTIRVLAGHGATGIRYSSWLLGFSMFLFLSLALLKRYIELHRLRQAGGEASTGRGYIIGDLALVLCIGTLSGWISALVLSLYIGSEDVRVLYRDPLRLLFICPLLLYWISRIWFLATRGAIDDDPVTFALKDKTSYILGVLAALFVWLATI
jgi:4-hydroxybenzoate polyprenyltransferase